MAGIFGLFAKVIGCVLGLGKYAWVFIRSVFLSRAGAAARIVALESQLDVCLRRSELKRARRFSDAFRFLWVILSKFWDGWERVCHAMKPLTVTGWQQKVFQFFWRGKCRGEVGRKRITVELRKLIRRISRENPLWEAEKIRDVLVDLGFESLDVGTVRKYMPRRKHPRNPSGNWLSFIRNHLDVSWAMDFCVVRTIDDRIQGALRFCDHGTWAATNPALGGDGVSIVGLDPATVA